MHLERRGLCRVQHLVDSLPWASLVVKFLNDGLHLGIEKITGAALRKQQLWATRVGFNLASQPQALHVDAPGDRVVFRTSAQFQQLVATEDAFWRTEKSGKQGEFRVGKLGTHAVAGHKPP